MSQICETIDWEDTVMPAANRGRLPNFSCFPLPVLSTVMFPQVVRSGVTKFVTRNEQSDDHCPVVMQ